MAVTATGPPTDLPVTTPPVLTAAMTGSAELQPTRPVRSSELPSSKAPLAASTCETPAAMVGDAGLTATAVSAALLTVIAREPVTPPDAAATVTAPAATAAKFPPSAVASVG